MKSPKSLLIGIVLATLFIPGGKVPVSHAAETRIAVSISSVPLWIEVGWREYRAAQSGQRPEDAARTRERIQEQALREGIRRFDLFSGVLIQEGETALAEGDPSRAVLLGEEAREWSPGDPRASFFLAKALSYQNPYYPFKAVGIYLDGLMESFRDFKFSFLLLGRLILILAVGILAGFLTFLFFLLIRSLRLLAHSFYEWGIFNRAASWAFILLLIFIPTALGLGPVWVIILLLSFLWPFMTRGERALGGGFVVVFGLAMFWMVPFISWYTMDPSRDWIMVSQVRQGDAQASGAIQRTRERETGPTDWLVQSSLALQNKREGRLPIALENYLGAVRSRPNDPLLLNNLGNVYFLMKQYDQAIAAYQQSISQDPASPIPHYNLNVTYRELLRFEDAKAEYEKAQAIDMPSTQRFTQLGQVVVDMTVSPRALWSRAFVSSPNKEERAERLFSALFGPVSLEWSPILLAIFPVSWGAFRIVFSQKRVGVPCSLCSRPVCFHCQRRILDLRICQTCWVTSKNVKRKADLPQLKFRRRSLFRTTRWISLLLPGGGHFLLGRNFRGALYSGTFGGVLFTLVFHRTFLRPPGTGATILDPATLILLGMVVIVVYFGVYRDLYRINARTAG